MTLRRLIAPSVAIIFQLVLATGTGYAQIPADFTAPPQDTLGIDTATGARKVGYFLETQFKPYFTKCAGQQMKSSGGAPLTSIPEPIVQAVGLSVWDWVLQPLDYSVANGFSSIIEATDLSKATLPSAVVPANQLPFDALQDPSTMMPQGVTGMAYSANCTAILASALSVDANISFPFAKLSSMVSADYSSSTQGELGMVLGQFDNPFLDLYSGRVGGDDGAVLGHLILWDWYRNKYAGKAAIPNDSLAVLSWFKGISMYRVSKQARSLDGKIDVKGSASYLGFVNGSGNLDAQYKSYGFLNVNSFAMALFRPSPGGQPTFAFVSLDTPSAIASWLGAKALARNVTQGNKQSLHKGTEIHQNQQVIGAPSSLCSPGLWTTDPAVIAGIGSLRVVGANAVAATKDGDLPRCTFDVGYTPADTLFGGPGIKNASVPYSLKTTIANLSVTIPAQTISYQTNNLPALNNTTATPYPFDPVQSIPGTTLGWKVVLNVAEDQAAASHIDFTKNPSGMNDFSLTGCRLIGAVKPILVSEAFNGNRQLEVTINQFIQGGSGFKPDAPDNVTCGISGTLQFQLSNGDLSVLSLPDSVLLVYPNPGGQGFKPGSVQKLPQ